jgi:hypothetical protein
MPKGNPNYLDCLKGEDVNFVFIEEALKSYPVSKVRNSLAVGLRKKAMSVKDTQPDAAEFFYDKSESLKRGEEIRIFGKKIPGIAEGLEK